MEFISQLDPLRLDRSGSAMKSEMCNDFLSEQDANMLGHSITTSPSSLKLFGNTSSEFNCLGSSNGGYGCCRGCGTEIIDPFLLHVNGHSWHQKCLRCAACNVPLSSHLTCYVAKDDMVYCKADYLRYFGIKCAHCSRAVSATDWVRRAKQLVYHLACFACNTCHRQLSTGEEFALHESNVLCKQHYLELLEIPGSSKSGSSPLGTHSSHADKHSDHINSSGGDSSEDGASELDMSLGSPHNKSKRSRTTFSEDQLKVLQANFNMDSNPDGQDLERIAQQTGLSKRVIQVWFQNARSRQKKHMTGYSAAANGKISNHGMGGSYTACGDELSPNSSMM